MSSSPLTSKDRARLRSKAHHLQPVAHIGTAGVTEASLESVEEAFNNRELIKVKVQENAPAPANEIADQLRDGIEDASVVQVIGRVIVLHRPLPKE